MAGAARRRHVAAVLELLFTPNPSEDTPTMGMPCAAVNSNDPNW